jgi:4-methoxybenzoate monooxygenase (O-demethylating)
LTVPILDIDPFSDECLLDPFPLHEMVREAGPVVWLSQYDVWAVGRYSEVAAVLNDWTTFSSASGVGLSNLKKERTWRFPSILLEVDPPDHDVNRMVLNRILAAPAIRKLRVELERVADEFVDRLIDQQDFDAIPEIAEGYPLAVFPDALGMAKDGRENLLPWGDMIFNSFGPENERFRRSIAGAEHAKTWITRQSTRVELSATGFGAQIYEFVDTGEITNEVAAAMIRAFLSAGVDTTVSAIGAAIFCLAQFPEQWELVRKNTKLVRAAFEEAVRYESPIASFFRTTTKTTALAGTELGAEEKILMFLGSANRDPRKWDRPDDFDVQRTVMGHVGFGMGVHGCVGQMLARLEGEIILGTLAKRVARIELTAQPKRRLNNSMRGFAALPVRLHPA